MNDNQKISKFYSKTLIKGAIPYASIHSELSVVALGHQSPP